MSNTRIDVLEVTPATAATVDGVTEGTPSFGVAISEAHGSTAFATDALNALPEAHGDFYAFPNGSRFSKDFVDGLVAQIIERAPLLDRGQEWTLRQICGVDYWLRLSKGECIDAGHCGARLAMGGFVPLVYTKNKNVENSQLYRLK